MLVPQSEHYRGYAIAVQALRRAQEIDKPPDGLRYFDIVVTISRQLSGEHGKSEMFGVPEQAPFESQVEAHKTGVQYARDIIDGKVDGQSIDRL
jgi:hypothetical protein